jgi:hypothetical protein
MTVHVDELSTTIEPEAEPHEAAATVNPSEVEIAHQQRRQAEGLRRERLRTAARNFDD